MSTVLARRIPAPEPADAVLLPVSGFPMKDDERAAVLGIVHRILGAAQALWHVSPELFVRFYNLNTAESATRFSQNGRSWKPQLGLGVWLGRPLHLWTKEDFVNLSGEERPRVAVDKVFRISAKGSARSAAFDAMFGAGSLSTTLIAEDSSAFLSRSKEALQTSSEDPFFRTFTFRTLLLDAASVGGASHESLGANLCGAKLYLRESPEDRGVIVVSPDSLTPVLEASGARPHADSIEWILPAA